MYAIVKTGGKQYRVERGQRLLIERLAVEEGADVALEPILYRSEEAVFDQAGLKGVKVTARVLAHVRGEKLRVFKFKPKRGYKRRTGHRQELTQIEVTEISGGGKPAKPAKTAAQADAPKETAASVKARSAGAQTEKAGAQTEKAGAQTEKARAETEKASAQNVKATKEKDADGS
jgi:large subunit ribosomal protein L21